MLGPDPREHARYYEGDIGSGYPLPEHERQGTNIPWNLVKTAAMFAAFPVMMALSQRGLAYASRRVAGTAARYAVRSARTRGFATAFHRLSQRSWRAGHNPFISPTVGQALRKTSTVDTLVSKYRSWQRGMGVDVAEYRRWAAMAQRQAQASGGARFGASYASKASQRMARFRAFFKDKRSPAFRGRLVGHVEHFLRDYATILPGIFVADKALGLMTGQSRPEPGPQWWNFPAHARDLASDFARTAISFLPMRIAFGGMIGGAKLGKDIIERNLKYRFSRMGRASGGGSGMQEYLYNAARQVDQLRTRITGTEGKPGYLARLRGAQHEWFRSFHLRWRSRVPRPIATLKYWGGNIAAGWRRGHFTPPHPLTEVPQANFLRELDMIRGIPPGGAYTDAMRSVMESYDRPKVGFMARIAGLRPMKLTQRMGDNTVGEVMRRMSMQNLPPQLQEHVSDWVRSRYYHRGVFNAGRGRAIDLRRWRPTEVISRAVDVLHEKFALRTPMGALRPFEIFRLRRLKNMALGKAPNVYEWTEGHRVRVGPLPMYVSEIPGRDPTELLRAGWMAGDQQPAIKGYNPLGAYVDIQPGARMLWVKSGRGAGRLFYHDREIPTALEFMADRPYKLVEEPLHGSLRQIQDTFYGARPDPLMRFDAANYQQETQRMQEAYGWPKWRAWFHSRVLRTPSEKMLSNMQDRKWAWPGLEIGAGYGNIPGPLTRVRNLFMKYFRRDSPLVYMSEERGFLTHMARRGRGPHNYVNEDNLQPTLQFIRGARSALNDSLDEAWHILRRREIYSKFAGHRVAIPNWEGRSPTLGDLFGDTAAGRGNLVRAVRGILGTAEPGTPLPGPWEKARHILDTVQSDEGFWTHVATKTPRGRELTAADELKKFIFRHHIIGQARQHRDTKYLQNLLADINIGRKGLLTGTNRELTLIRSVDTLAHLEDRMGQMPLSALPDPTKTTYQEDLAGFIGGAEGGPANRVIDYLMGERGTLAQLSKIFQPPTSTKLPDIVKAPIWSTTTTTSPYEVVIGGFFPKAGDQIKGRGTLRGLRSIISPRYVEWGPDGRVMTQQGRPLTQPYRFLTEATMRFERLGEAMGFGLNLHRRSNLADIWGGIFSRIALPAAGVYTGYRALDTFFDVNPMFAGTALDEGLSVAVAEQEMKHRLRMARLSDITGATSTFRYMEGLMPGAISSPLSRIGRVVAPPLVGAALGGVMGPTGAGVGMVAGAGIAGLTGFGMWDVTRTREELEDIYAGREMVPVRRGAGWLFGRELMSGSRVQYWRPNFFARMKSQHKFTPTLYGSKLEEFMYRNPIMAPIAMAWDPYHWERKGYFSAPYPETGAFLESVPFAGPVLATTLGRAIKPIRTMHRREQERSFVGVNPLTEEGGLGPRYFPPPGMQVNVPSPFIPATIKEVTPTGTQVRRPYPRSMYGLRQTVGRTFYRSYVEPLGIWGWGVEQAMGGGHPFDADTVMANAGERTSVRRAFWETINSNAIGGITEYPRRFYPRQRKQIERWNPLYNRMPGWLPGGIDNEYFIDFRTGDPFSKVQEGELRLPGWGNLAAYHTKLSMPFRASQLGRTYEEMVQFLTGTRPPAAVEEIEAMESGTVMHKIIQDELMRANLLVKAEAPVFDPYSNISGTVDAVVRRGRRKVALEIKTTSTEKLEQLASPERAHRSQINFYLKGLGLREGTIMYLARDNPTLTRTFPVQYSQSLYQADIARLQGARATAGQLLSMGYGYPGEAYSHLDRLRVLADVAPYSDNYKRQLQLVNQMDKMGFLEQDEHREKLDIVKRRRSVVRSYDLYPRRFDVKGVFTPDDKYQQLSQNEFIKAAAEYSLPERIMGSAYEYLTHQRSPIHSKLMGMYSPREQYERFVLYGRRSAFWGHPVRDFVEPYMRAALATRRPDEGMIRGLQAGFLLGGPPGAALGAGALGVYGAVSGGYRWLTDSTYIPGNVKGKWELSDYFDKLKYLKARRLYQLTGGQEYARMMGETMVGMNPMRRDRASFTQVARAVPYELRPYIFAFMKETDEGERDRIASGVPPNVAQLLRIKWSMADKDKETASRLTRGFQDSQDLTTYYQDHRLPDESYLGWHPSVKLEDIAVKTIDRSGYDAHDFGMGWYDQMRRIKYSPLTPKAIDIHDPTGANVYPELALDQNEVRTVVTNILRQYGAQNIMVNLSVTPGLGSRVTLNANVDRSVEIQRQLGTELARIPA